MYDRDDKFIAAGFNVNFDLDFLRETWFATGGKYGPGSWIFNCPIDVRTTVAEAIGWDKLRLPNFKLGTVCEYYGVELGEDAHDAMADIEATRKLYHALMKRKSFKKAA